VSIICTIAVIWLGLSLVLLPLLLGVLRHARELEDLVAAQRRLTDAQREAIRLRDMDQFVLYKWEWERES